MSFTVLYELWINEINIYWSLNDVSGSYETLERKASAQASYLLNITLDDNHSFVIWYTLQYRYKWKKKRKYDLKIWTEINIKWKMFIFEHAGFTCKKAHINDKEQK